LVSPPFRRLRRRARRCARFTLKPPIPKYDGGRLPRQPCWSLVNVTITIIDDDESVRESLPDLLRELGFSVEAFASAEAFLASESGQDPSVLIVDVAMPGMSGLDLQQELLRSGDPVPLIFMTAQTSERIRQRVLESGAVACLFKPFTESDLVDAVNRALDGA
jgi:FixJ family two-component response regulator